MLEKGKEREQRQRKSWGEAKELGKKLSTFLKILSGRGAAPPPGGSAVTRSFCLMTL